MTNFEISVSSIEEAITRVSRSNGSGSDLADMFASLADSLNSLERYKEAAEAYRRALAVNPNDARTRYSLGKVFLQLGDQRAALEQYSILKRIERGTIFSYAEMLLKEIKN